MNYEMFSNALPIVEIHDTGHALKNKTHWSIREGKQTVLH